MLQSFVYINKVIAELITEFAFARRGVDWRLKDVCGQDVFDYAKSPNGSIEVRSYLDRLNKNKP